MTYYLVKTGPDRFDMRQTRYKKQFETGAEHPHDLMATGFTADDMRALIEKYFSGRVNFMELLK